MSELRTKEESDTPRTDAVTEAFFNLRKNRFGSYVPAEFAKQLERELAGAKSLNATLERSNHRLRAKFDRSYP